MFLKSFGDKNKDSDHVSKFKLYQGGILEFSKHICDNWYSNIIFSPNYRKAEFFRMAKFIVLDFDGTVSKATMEEKFSKYNFIIAPTKSDGIMKTEDQLFPDRFRFILELDGFIISKEHYLAKTKSLIEYTNADPQAGDAGKAWKPSKSVEVVNQGILFPAAMEVEQKPTVEFKPSEVSLVRKAQEYLSKDWQSGERNALACRTALTLFDAGFDHDEVASIILNKSGLDVREVNDVIKWAFKKSNKNVD